ncbi:hypothetical protein F5888DRAFT_1637465 [Russula emetica]|nr:hypothetical protein F5888DRAFT_1637465 [Russula emetica]
MLNNSHIYHQTLHDIQKHGIDEWTLPVEGVKLNLPQMLKVKDDTVQGLTKGIELLIKQNKIDNIKGTASFLKKGGESTVEVKNVIIATGSEIIRSQLPKSLWGEAIQFVIQVTHVSPRPKAKQRNKKARHGDFKKRRIHHVSTSKERGRVR